MVIDFIPVFFSEEVFYNVPNNFAQKPCFNLKAAMEEIFFFNMAHVRLNQLESSQVMVLMT